MAMTTVQKLMAIVPSKPSKPRKIQILWTAATGIAEVTMLSHTYD